MLIPIDNQKSTKPENTAIMTTKKKKTKNIKGTKTEENLVKAYLAESAAYTRYTYYAAQAEKENYFPIQELFTETAKNELRHSKVYFKYLKGGNITVPMAVDAGVIGDTASNLATAAEEELREGSEMYLEMARVADDEGFAEIAEHFRAIASIEDHHRRHFLRYLRQVKEGTVWKRKKAITWKCLVCGYEHTGTEPPEECPACDHPREHYMGMDDDEEEE